MNMTTVPSNQLKAMQHEIADLKEQVAQLEFSWAGCSQQLKDACKDLDEAEETITQQAEAIQSLENHIADSADAAAIAMRKAWQLGQTYWQQADSEYYSQQDKSVVTQERFSKLVSDTCEEIKSIPTIQPSPDILQARDARVAEACALMCHHEAHVMSAHGDSGVEGANWCGSQIRNGGWKEYL